MIVAVKPASIGIVLRPCKGCGKVPKKISHYQDYGIDGYFVRCNRSSKKCPVKPMTYIAPLPLLAAQRWNKINGEM